MNIISNKTLVIGLFVFLSACSDPDRQATVEPGTKTAVDRILFDNETLQAGIEAGSTGRDTENDQDQQIAQAGTVTPETYVLADGKPVPPAASDEYKRVDAAAPLFREMEESRLLARESIAGKMLSERAYMLNDLRAPSEPVNRENYFHYDDNPVKLVTEHPVSTFSIDVDTGSYANVRRMLNSGTIPPRDAVRTEELINYFSYDYPLPESMDTPFAVVKEIAPAPWRKGSYLLHLGIKGYEVPASELPASNLVFLVDVSGSMQSANKLELLKTSLKLLTRHLSADDHVSLVVYAGASGVVLEPTPGDQKARITSALDQLTAGGRTNGAAGIRLAYAMAEQGFIQGGINRVLIATDGDFNVGTVDHEQLKNLIEEKRKTGISLSTLGFGTGNYNDHLMEQLADTGNGNYAYIDTVNEAQKVLVDEISSTLLTIAKDVKIQIEFNPAIVSEYRLIGYENRVLKREDFNNDKVDAGEIGAGHSVTALYEITFTDSPAQRIDPLRYQTTPTTGDDTSTEIAFLKLRYKAPDADTSRLLTWTINKDEITPDIDKTSDAWRFAAAVAAFAQQLRGGEALDNFGYDGILQLARTARGEDLFGYRGEFLSLINLARSISVAQYQDRDSRMVKAE